MGRYDPERLAVYRLARRHTRAVKSLLEGADTRGFAKEVDNLRRSTGSIPANIKEGYGEHRPRKKANYYEIAKSSVAEAWAHLDTLVDFGLLDPDDITDARDLQNQMIALLVTMARNQLNRPDQPLPFAPPPFQFTFTFSPGSSTPRPRSSRAVARRPGAERRRGPRSASGPRRPGP